MKISKNQKIFFRENGYFIIKDYINKKILNEIQSALKVMLNSYLTKKENKLENAINIAEKINHKFVYNCQKIITSSESGIKLVSSLNLAKIYQELYEVKSNQIHFQPLQTPIQFPNDTRFDFQWHQESGSYNGFSKILTCWFPIFNKVNKKNGSVSLIPKSHLVGKRKSTFYKKKSGLRDWRIQISKEEEKKSFTAQMKPGDILLFDSDIVHKSVKNFSNKVRITGIVRCLDLLSRKEILPLVEATDTSLGVQQ